MEFTFRRAVRENVSLIIGLAGGTGSGKTYTAMRLAKGICGDKPFAVIDTEAGRAKHYADQFAFDHGDLAAPFRPQSYLDAIASADKAGYPVVVVDSVSHVWAGDGGVIDWQEQELTRMAGDDWKKRESCKMAAWIKPKMAHKQMVQKLLQLRAHLILCFRAEPKIEMVRGDDGKMRIQEKQSPTGFHGWLPVCEKNLPFELTISFLLLAEKPGIPNPIKLQEQHRTIFDLAKPIGEEQGRKLAAWSKGNEGKPPQPAPKDGPAVTAAAPSTSPSTPAAVRQQTAEPAGNATGAVVSQPGAEPPPALTPMSESTYNCIVDLMIVVPPAQKTIEAWLSRAGVDDIRKIDEERGMLIVKSLKAKSEKQAVK